MAAKFLEKDDNSEKNGEAMYAGWIYHLGSNTVGYQFCHPRYMVIKGKYIEMYKRDPNEFPHKRPIRRGVAGKFMMIEEVGRQIFHGRVIYVLKIYSRVDHRKHGEIGCSSAEESEKWITAFQHAKEQAEYGSKNVIGNQDFHVNGPRFHSKSYLSRLIYIGRGPEFLLRRPSMVAQEPNPENYYNKRASDAVEQAEWKCIRTVNGLRIFEDIAASKSEKGTIMKSVGVVEATPEMIFEMIMSLDQSQRQQWDTVTGQLELLEHIDGHSDIVYGSFDPKYFKRWSSLFSYKRSFVLSRYWRRDQDGSYSITQIPVTRKSLPGKKGLRPIVFNTGVWEITPLASKPVVGTPRSLVTQIMEVKSTGFGRWKKSHFCKLHTTVPYALLCRTAGLREYFAAEGEQSLLDDRVASVAVAKSITKQPGPTTVPEPETNEQFYDAIMGAAEDEDDDDSEEEEKKPLNKAANHHKLRNVTWGIMLGLNSQRPPARDENGELMLNFPSVEIDPSLFHSTLRYGCGEKDFNCWKDPGGQGFMVRGKTYIKDYLKVPGGDPLFKLLSVDWLKSDDKISGIAKHPSSIVQSAAGKALPFIFVVNLQVPAKPNYSLVFYFGADRPIQPGSLLDKFANGDDAFRNARFKLIPSIVEGYWVVKRAVGTKACLLGRAVTCHYLREDNFFEIDVDIGSSSVARGVIGLVLGYVTNIVVDLAILIEAKDEKELPEYLLGTTRINKIVPEDAKKYDSF